jgi:gamma-glutamylcyclotransferase (GGCT)/AIG2-like uncharacterized protein YtfP
MAGFDRRRLAGIDGQLAYLGRAWTKGNLYDLGLYPAAIPADEGRIWGELYETSEPEDVLPALDELEGADEANPEQSLYQRSIAKVTLIDGDTVDAWVYFYNAPLGQASRIPSGDYHEHFKHR